MPPKQKSAASDKAKDVQDTEDHLQAVVMSDSFETRFAPFTNLRPRCLLPLVNVPLIEYTLEFLATSGVKEVYLYCGAHTDQIEDYVKSSRWVSPSSPFHIELIRSTSRSIGDAMRDLDKRAILTGDFIIVYGDVVTNMNMDKALAEHRARRALDKNAIMTMVLRQTRPQHQSQPNDMLPVFIVDPARQRCVHYEQITGKGSGQQPHIDQDLLDRDLDVHVDLLDCGVDICTPDVLALWSDNFDYEAPRKGFLHSVLKDYELNGKTIHTHILNQGYAARVRNLQAYETISQDVLARWTFPLAPDVNWDGLSQYKRVQDNVYLDRDVKVARSSRLGPNVVIGERSTVGARTVMSDSIIGRGCQIGVGCRIINAHVWDEAWIADGANVRGAIIGVEARVGRNTTIQKGALISDRVHIRDGVVIKQRRRLVRKHNDQEGLQPGSNYEERPRDQQNVLQNVKSLRSSSSQDSISTLASETSSFEEDPVNHRDSVLSATSDDSHGTPSAEAFVVEAANSIHDALQQSQDVGTIQLELQGLRMAANASEHHVRRAVVSGLLRYVGDAQKAGRQIKDIVATNHTLIERTVFDEDAETKKDQVDFLLLLQADTAKWPAAQGESTFQALCNGLYLVDEEGLFEVEAYQQWWEDPRSRSSDSMARLREKMQQFMDVIGEDSEEESGEDSDDEEDGSEEE